MRRAAKLVRTGRDRRPERSTGGHSWPTPAACQANDVGVAIAHHDLADVDDGRLGPVGGSTGHGFGVDRGSGSVLCTWARRHGQDVFFFFRPEADRLGPPRPRSKMGKWRPRKAALSPPVRLGRNRDRVAHHVSGSGKDRTSVVPPFGGPSQPDGEPRRRVATARRGDMQGRRPRRAALSSRGGTGAGPIERFLQAGSCAGAPCSAGVVVLQGDAGPDRQLLDRRTKSRCSLSDEVMTSHLAWNRSSSTGILRR